LRRFIARRGKPRTILTDNGSNFLGTANELHNIYKMFQSTSEMATIKDYLAAEGCEWSSIPFQAPQFGGLWEAVVMSMKHQLRITLGSHVATYE